MPKAAQIAAGAPVARKKPIKEKASPRSVAKKAPRGKIALRAPLDAARKAASEARRKRCATMPTLGLSKARINMLGLMCGIPSFTAKGRHALQILAHEIISHILHRTTHLARLGRKKTVSVRMMLQAYQHVTGRTMYFCGGPRDKHKTVRNALLAVKNVGKGKKKVAAKKEDDAE